MTDVHLFDKHDEQHYGEQEIEHLNTERLQEIKDLVDNWIYDEGMTIAIIKELITALEEAQVRITELGDSLYNKDPDLASRMYNITPTWETKNT